MTKQTIGDISSKLIIKQSDDTHSAHEQMEENLTDYDKNLYECVESAKSIYVIGDFYVVVTTKKERLMPNVIRNYFFSRYSCPTPEYDQIVYKFHRKDEQIEFLWVVPCKETCEIMRLDPLNVPTQEKELLDFVLSFEDGTLLKLSKKLNNEEEDSLGAVITFTKT